MEKDQIQIEPMDQLDKDEKLYLPGKSWCKDIKKKHMDEIKQCASTKCCQLRDKINEHKEQNFS